MECKVESNPLKVVLLTNNLARNNQTSDNCSSSSSSESLHQNHENANLSDCGISYYTGSVKEGKVLRVRGPWTEEEDTKLRAIVGEHGPKHWSSIAQHLNTGRVGKQCRER